jgi:hypothetical protein
MSEHQIGPSDEPTRDLARRVALQLTVALTGFALMVVEVNTTTSGTGLLMFFGGLAYDSRSIGEALGRFHLWRDTRGYEVDHE